MTSKEKQTMIEKAAEGIWNHPNSDVQYIARDILAPMFAKIEEAELGRDIARGNAEDVYKRLSAKIADLKAERNLALQAIANREALLVDASSAIGHLETENAALRQRPVVDDAMVKRAIIGFDNSTAFSRHDQFRAALKAALGEDAT